MDFNSGCAILTRTKHTLASARVSPDGEGLSSWPACCIAGKNEDGICIWAEQGARPRALAAALGRPAGAGEPRQRGFEERAKISKIWAARDPAAPGLIPSAAGFVRARRLISMLAGRRRCGALALRALRALLAYQLFLLLATMSSVFGSPGSCARRRAQTAFPLGMPTWPPVSSGTA